LHVAMYGIDRDRRMGLASHPSSSSRAVRGAVKNLFTA
jgi:hypothetical protein